MSFPTVKPVIRLRERCRHVQWIALSSGLLSLGLGTLLFLPSYGSRRALLLAPLLLVYLVRKGQKYHKAREAVRQLRLEEQFLRQSLKPDQLRRCLYGNDHLWRNSIILRALKSILAHPLPRLLRPQEKKRRIRNQYRHILDRFRFPRTNPDLFLLLTLIIAWGLLLPSSFDVEGAWSPLWWTGLTVTLAASVAEGLDTLLHRRLHSSFATVEEALCEWTLAQKLEQNLRTIRRTLYTHHSLYQAPPWFATGRTTEVSSDPPLSEP